METPSVVQAEYSFKGSNNDELCFKKGDIIVVTNREDGGWWEGTLGEKTGWFPSNYVKEHKTAVPVTDPIRPPEEVQASRLLVLDDLMESEKAHVAEIRGLLENFLEPLESSQIVNADEYAQLMGNFVEVVETHEDLLINIEENLQNDRVGKLFLSKAPSIKKVHLAYCASHPKAIIILDKYKDELETFMERQGAVSPGLLVLTTGLSKPFRRLDKYSAMLQELERYQETGHPDRGDTQRSVAVYKEIAASCAALRRQKELELQVLTGPVRNWQGQELVTLGDIIHMGSVAVGPDHRDRYFVLFPQTLLILSVSQRMSAFIYEGKLPLTNIAVRRLEDTDNIKNAFEIQGTLIEAIVAVCQGPAEADKWVDLLTQNMLEKRRAGTMDIKRNMSPPMSGTMHHTVRGMSTSAQNQLQHKRSLSFNHHLNYNQYQLQQQQQQLQHQSQQPQSLQGNVSSSFNNTYQPYQTPPARPSHNPYQMLKDVVVPRTTPPLGNQRANWSYTHLKPAPPVRPNFVLPTFSGNQSQLNNSGSSGGGTIGSGASSANTANGLNSSGTPTRKIPPTYEEDALVLRVIESYCAAYQNTNRNTTHSGMDNGDEASMPTLRQMWMAMKQLQQDMSDMKGQLNMLNQKMGRVETVMGSNS